MPHDRTVKAWRDFIKQTIRSVVTQPDQDLLTSIQRATEASVPESERDDVLALIVEELRRLHEGVLAHYGLKPSEFVTWKAKNTH